MGDEVGISDYLPTRFTLPWSSVWDVVYIHFDIYMLHHSIDYYGVPKNRKLAIHKILNRAGLHIFIAEIKCAYHKLDQ